jgi:hypothetical protein
MAGASQPAPENASIQQYKTKSNFSEYISSGTGFPKAVESM